MSRLYKFYCALKNS